MSHDEDQIKSLFANKELDFCLFEGVIAKEFSSIQKYIDKTIKTIKEEDLEEGVFSYSENLKGSVYKKINKEKLFDFSLSRQSSLNSMIKEKETLKNGKFKNKKRISIGSYKTI